MENELKNCMFIENESPYHFDRSVEILLEKVCSAGWGVQVVHNMQEVLLKKTGKEILPVKVIELCKPAFAEKMLSDDALRTYSPMMPCRISVYETSGRKVFFSRLNMKKMTVHIGGAVEQVMTLAFNEIENILAEITRH